MEESIFFGLGKLKKTKPDSLISADGKVNDFDSFFLILALIFNDIKGLVYFDRFVKLKKPANLNIVSGENGEYFGLNTQIFKMAASNLFEFMMLLEKNRNIIDSDKFLSYLRKLSNDNKSLWNLLYHVVFSKDEILVPDKLDFKNILIQIRSNVSFHYYQSGKPLANGFREHFFKNSKINKESRDYAYYSIKQSAFDENRFYYADAAITAYISKILNDAGDTETISGRIIQLSGFVSLVIVGLLDIYLQEKKCI